MSRIGSKIPVIRPSETSRSRANSTCNRYIIAFQQAIMYSRGFPLQKKQVYDTINDASSSMQAVFDIGVTENFDLLQDEIAFIQLVRR